MLIAALPPREMYELTLPQLKAFELISFYYCYYNFEKVGGFFYFRQIAQMQLKNGDDTPVCFTKLHITQLG